MPRRKGQTSRRPEKKPPLEIKDESSWWSTAGSVASQVGTMFALELLRLAVRDAASATYSSIPPPNPDYWDPQYHDGTYDANPGFQGWKEGKEDFSRIPDIDTYDHEFDWADLDYELHPDNWERIDWHH